VILSGDISRSEGATMNSKIAILAGGAALATATVGLGLDGAASAHAVTHTMTFRTPQIQDRIVNGIDVATDKNVQNGTVVGYDVTSCAVNVDTHIARCDVALARAAGLMYARARVNVVTNKGAGTVTGGTRRFAGASGTITVAGGRVTIRWSN
jgi:hypothetical protein